MSDPFPPAPLPPPVVDVVPARRGLVDEAVERFGDSWPVPGDVTGRCPECSRAIVCQGPGGDGDSYNCDWCASEICVDCIAAHERDCSAPPTIVRGTE